jgi:hypothetical protein
MGFTRPGKLLNKYRKTPCYEWVNPLFLWPFSTAMLVYRRVNSPFFLVVEDVA